MLILGMILKFCKDNWQLVLAGLAVLALVGYITALKMEVSHYKGKYEEVSAELASAQHREDVLKAEVEGLTTKYKDSLVETKKVVEMNTKLLEEAIQNDIELNTLRVSYNAISLFNKSKRDPSSPASQAVKGNAGKASTTVELSDPNTGFVGRTVPLSEIFSLVAKNDANHWKCVKQVEAWQGFWSDYEGAVKRAGAAGGP